MPTNDPISGLDELTVLADADLLVVVDDSEAVVDDKTKRMTAKTARALAASVKTATYTLAADDDVIIANSGSAMTLNLPAVAGRTRPYYLKNINIGIVTVDPNGAETIDGAATLEMAERDAFVLIPTSSGWETW